MEPVLIGGRWRPSEAPPESFRATNPATGQPIEPAFPISSDAEVETVLVAGAEAAAALRRVKPELIAAFLERYADLIVERAGALVEAAGRETGLPAEPRLRSVELPRTIDQLRQAARAAAERSWCHATIDTARNIRSRYAALGGPVVVFGPNNFPFAFNSAAGGDMAAAVAAGNPVIAKANPGHPLTTRLFAEAAHEAAQQLGLPPATVQLIYRTSHEAGLRLVSDARIGATGFTGSRAAGLRLKAAADRAGKPIYLELSSVNPVFVLPGALRERSATLADELFAACTSGAGQFCTKPGLVALLADEAGRSFVAEACRRFESSPPGVLLGESGLSTIVAVVTRLQQSGAALVTGGQPLDGAGYRYAHTILSVQGAQFLAHPEVFQSEAFGPVTLMVYAVDADELEQIAALVEGSLTGTLYTASDGSDDDLYGRLEPLVRLRVGRLLNDKMPTGVAVSPAMNHGGPFPATGHPGFTAVGIPAALLRFAALQSYDNVRPERLPPELQDRPPQSQMWRLIDGVWTQGAR